MNMFEQIFTLWIIFGYSPDTLADYYYINGTLKSSLNFLDYVTTWNGVCMMDNEDLNLLKNKGKRKGIEYDKIKLIELYINSPIKAKNFYNNFINKREKIIAENLDKL